MKMLLENDKLKTSVKKVKCSINEEKIDQFFKNVSEFKSKLDRIKSNQAYKNVENFLNENLVTDVNSLVKSNCDQPWINDNVQNNRFVKNCTSYSLSDLAFDTQVKSLKSDKNEKKSDALFESSEKDKKNIHSSCSFRSYCSPQLRRKSYPVSNLSSSLLNLTSFALNSSSLIPSNDCFHNLIFNFNQNISPKLSDCDNFELPQKQKSSNLKIKQDISSFMQFKNGSMVDKGKSKTYGNSPTFNLIANELMNEPITYSRKSSRVAQIASKFDENNYRKFSLNLEKSLKKSNKRNSSLADDTETHHNKSNNFFKSEPLSTKRGSVKETIFKLESKMSNQIKAPRRAAKNLTQKVSLSSSSLKTMTEPVVKQDLNKSSNDLSTFPKRKSTSFLEAKNYLPKIKFGSQQNFEPTSSKPFLKKSSLNQIFEPENLNKKLFQENELKHFETQKRYSSTFLCSNVEKKNQTNYSTKEKSNKAIDSCINVEDVNVYDEPIYELVNETWSTSSSSASAILINEKELKLGINHSESDANSLNSESSSLYSDSSSYSSNYYHDSNHLFRNFSKSLPPPPLPPRRYSNNLKFQNMNTIESNFNLANKLLTDFKYFQESHEYETIPNYFVNQATKDFADTNHIYQTIYNSLPTDKSPEKGELLNNLIRDLSNLIKIDHSKANSLGISRTPSTISSSSISRNSSSASDGKEKIWLSHFYQKSDINPSQCLQKSKLLSQMTFDKNENEKHEKCDTAEYENFLEQKFFLGDSLMESISNSSSPQLKEFINKGLQNSKDTTSSIKDIKTVSNFEAANEIASTLCTKDVDEEHYQDGHSSFTTNQPLYQFYDMQVKQQNVIWAQSNLSDLFEVSDTVVDQTSGDSIYAELNDCSNAKCFCTNCNGLSISPYTHPHMSAMDLVGRGFKRLWCEVPQVKDGRILESLSSTERKHQEAMFEVITSEASYLKSLDFLVNHFMNSAEFSNPEILDLRSKNDLFSLVVQVKNVSKQLMQDLDKRWQQNVIISDVCDILLDYALNKFHDYVKYITFQMKQEQTLKHLQKQPKFAEAFKKLESDSKCQGLSLISFLLLPMQRITRYPLLIEAILNHRSTENTTSYLLCQKTLTALIKVVGDCNAAAKEFERRHELIELGHKLKFDKVKSFPLVSSSRYLLKKCEVNKTKSEQSTLLYSARNKYQLRRKSANFLFLFNDLLVIGKKKSDDSYLVKDYCYRNMLQIKEKIFNDSTNGSNNTSFQNRTKDNQKNLIQLSFHENQEGKFCEYVYHFHSEAEKLRFLEAMEYPKSNDLNEKIYEELDCPQVICEKEYLAQQHDELTLEKSDVVNVFRKQNDWYEGERIRDGVKGWFPASVAREIVNKHVRSRNLKLRHRLLVLTEQQFLEKEKKQTTFTS